MKPNIGQGDAGKTHLPGGKNEADKVWKDSAQVEAYGMLDELNSFVGLLGAQKTMPQNVQSVLEEIQDYLFRAEFHISAQGTPYENSEVPVLREEAVRNLEESLEELEKKLPTLTHFILPGGTIEAALADVARTVSRRAERRIITWLRDVKNPTSSQKVVLAYVNRLSDYFMALSRHLNQQAGKEPLAWKGREKTE